MFILFFWCFIGQFIQQYPFTNFDLVFLALPSFILLIAWNKVLSDQHLQIFILLPKRVDLENLNAGSLASGIETSSILVAPAINTKIQLNSVRIACTVLFAVSAEVSEEVGSAL